MSDNDKPLASPVPEQFSVIVAGIVPPRYMEAMKAGRLRPSMLVFEQMGDHGITAGQPVTVPVRELLPEEAVACVQRAMAEGKVQPVVAFQVAQPKAKVQRV